MEWKRQGAALVGSFPLAGGGAGRVILSGAWGVPNAAQVVLLSARGSGRVEAVPLEQRLEHLTPEQVIDILCTQERAFGGHGLEPPDIP